MPFVEGGNQGDEARLVSPCMVTLGSGLSSHAEDGEGESPSDLDFGSGSQAVRGPADMGPFTPERAGRHF
jgi:hypothetical protein